MTWRNPAPFAPCQWCGEVDTLRGSGCDECREQQLWARSVLKNAVRSGEVVKPASCQACGVEPPEPRLLHAHHHRGYDRANALNVLWLCPKCHREAHRRVAVVAT